MTKPRIAVVVPAFNEAASLPAVIGDLDDLSRRQSDWDWLIVVVNDGSTDRTRQVLDELLEEHRLALVHCPVNIGIGAAVQVGLRLAVEWKADAVLQFDGDGQHSATAIPDLVEPVLAGRSDVVVGSRYLPDAGGAVSGLGRQLGTKLFSLLLRSLLGLRVRDVTSGFRAFNAEAAAFVVECYPDDYPEVETYVPLARARFRIDERPVEMQPRRAGRSSISTLSGAYYMLKVTLAVLIHLIRAIPKRRSVPREP